VAGTLASCLTNPLEVIKTQLQQSKIGTTNPTATATVSTAAAPCILPAQNALHQAYTIAQTIWHRDGARGFWRGLPPTLIGIVPSRSVYFYAYHKCQAWLHPLWQSGSPANALTAGLLAGMAGNTITNPLWMIRTRMQLAVDTAAGQVAYRGYLDVVRRIWIEQGVAGFYKGLTASYWGCTEGAIQFLLYEQCKTRLLARENAKRLKRGLKPTTELSRATYFWSAAVAKMVASMATYPHEVARTRMREQARLGVFKYNGMWPTIRVICQEEGRRGLYSGMGVHLLKVVPNSALMFLTYEIVRAWLGTFTIVDAVPPTRTTPTSLPARIANYRVVTTKR
jgi:solute carrier family 25, member 33/36